MRLPNFVIIGAAKAGTTSLYAILDRHPDIFMPRIKEPEFFARDDRYADGLASYSAAFESASVDQLVGEASTIYSLSPLFGKTAERMHTHIPDAKLIYVMRDPVKRAYSYYVQIIKNYQNVTKDHVVHRSFEQFILPDAHAAASSRDKVFSAANAHLPDTPELCLAGSDYVHQIETYLSHFRRDQILFLKFEDFVTDRPVVLRRITDFLGVAPLSSDVFAEESVTRNVADAHFDALSTQMAVEDMRRKTGAIWLLRRLVPKPMRAWLKARLASGKASPRPAPMRPETRVLLKARFAPQQAMLSEMTGLSFEDWDL